MTAAMTETDTRCQAVHSTKGHCDCKAFVESPARAGESVARCQECGHSKQIHQQAKR